MIVTLYLPLLSSDRSAITLLLSLIPSESMRLLLNVGSSLNLDLQWPLRVRTSEWNNIHRTEPL